MKRSKAIPAALLLALTLTACGSTAATAATSNTAAPHVAGSCIGLCNPYCYCRIDFLLKYRRFKKFVQVMRFINGTGQRRYLPYLRGTCFLH